MKRVVCAAWFAIAIFFMTGLPLYAAVLKRLTFEDLCTQAATIFTGICIGVDTDNPTTIRYTFKVMEFFKGNPADTLSVRFHKSAAVLAHVPTYTPGQKVLLFLYPESAQGFTSPVGFGQGSFFILQNDNGSSSVVNEYNNTHLFSRLRAESHYALRTEHRAALEAVALGGGPLAYEVFAELIRCVTAQKR